MIKKTWWKWLILIAALLGSAIALFEVRKDEDGTSHFASKLRYGLDIQGGYSFTLQLDDAELRNVLRDQNPDATPEEIEKKVEEATKNSDEVAAEIIRKRIDPLGTEEPVITRGKKDHRIYVQLAGADEKKRQMAEKSVRSTAFLEFRLVYPQNAAYVSRLFSEGKAPEGFRIAEGGDGQHYYVRDDDYAEKSRLPGFARKLARFEVPDDSKTYQCMLERSGGTDENPRYTPVYVKRKHELTGDLLKHATVGIDNYGQNEVRLEFNAEGRRKFGKVTTDNVGKQLAIVLDGTVYSAPVIRDAITGGNAQITGHFSQEEAVFLRNILNAGALPAPFKLIGQRFVSPTVGEDALHGAANAMLWGIGAILVFMLVYYGLCGVVADIAFLLNIALLALGTVIVSAVFSLFDPEISTAGSKLLELPVLTLPGIAGLLLTFGMAVDANVLTFERTREEFAAGKSKFAAIMAGYDRAFLAIFDSNLTTIITAAILFAFGSGSIRGFAITLTAGIIVSMFTVLVVTKLVFLATVKENSTGKIKMLQLVPANLSFDFVGKAKAYTIAAVALVVIGFGIGIGRGLKDIGRVFAVDFTGGAKISYVISNPETVTDRPAVLEKVRETFVQNGVTDAKPQFQQEGDTLILEVKTVKGDIPQETYSGAIAKSLTDNVPDTVFEWRDVDAVGSQIGDEFKKSARNAVLLALVGMVIYITIRFEFGFALGALAALVHDVLVTLGIYLLLGRQISLITVAAVLTIVGYSVNDTIVIFDRVREELRNPRMKSMPFPDLVNKCINTTLSRTVLTSLTTMFTVVALLVFSSGEIRDFAIIMLIGVVFGTLSTIFIANPVMLLWHKGKRPDLSEKR